MRRRITSTSEQRKRRRRRTLHVCKKAYSRTNKNGSRTASKKVSDKLEKLKNLIPISKSNNNGDDQIVKADQLFQETADYIVRLRTQVFILQRLVHLCGSTATSTSTTEPPATADDHNNVVL